MTYDQVAACRVPRAADGERGKWPAASGKGWLLWFTLALMALAALPYLWQWWRTPVGRIYLGVAALNVSDAYVYLGYLEQVRQGSWLLQNLHTGETGESGLFNILWLGIGLIGRAFDLAPVSTFHLARLLSIPALVYALWYALRLLLGDGQQRRWAMVLLWFTGGWGAFLALPLLGRILQGVGLEVYPMDLWVAELHPLSSALASPHFLWSWALLVLTLVNGWRGLVERRWRYSSYAALFFLPLAQFHPYYAVSIAAVLGALWLARSWRDRTLNWRGFAGLAVVGLGGLPGVAYQLWFLSQNQVAAAAAVNNLTLTTRWWLTLVAFGPLGLAALATAFHWLRRRERLSERQLLLVVWLLVGAALLYLPIPWQRRFTEGLWLPVVLLAMLGIQEWWHTRQPVFQQRLRRAFRPRVLAAALGLVALSISPIYVYLETFVHLPDFSRSRAEVAAAEWLRHLPPSAVVLAWYQTSRSLPALSGRRVYWGHWAETVGREGKAELGSWFFAGNGATAMRQAFLSQQGITHLFWGASERAIANFDPVGEPYLEPVFSNGAVVIYQVR